VFGKIKELLALNKALGQYNEIRKDIDTMDRKHLLLSKTFWLNVVGFAATVGGILPQKWAVPVLTIANIGNRLLTNQPVSLFPGQ
jgi:hypothetical protein